MKHLIYSVTLRSEPPKLFAEPCNESDHCYKKELRVNFVQIFVIQWTVHQQLDWFYYGRARRQEHTETQYKIFAKNWITCNSNDHNP